MVAEEYAKALYELALENKNVDDIQNELSSVCRTMENDFLKIISSPILDKKEKKDMLKKVYKSVNPLLLDFFYVLVDNDRFNILYDVYHSYKAFVRESNKERKIRIVSAVKLSDEQYKTIKRALELKYSGEKIVIKNIIDDSLVAGVRIFDNDEAIDLSLTSKLAKLKSSL